MAVRYNSSGSLAVPVVSWPELVRDAEERRQQQQENNAALGRDSTALPKSPGAILIDHLDRDVVRPHGEGQRTPSLSVLVPPALEYPHPGETRRSRLRHENALVRQARLEAIRQAQQRPLPDWRLILRRLVAYTPRLGHSDVDPLLSSSVAPPPQAALLSTSSPSSYLPPFPIFHRDAAALAFPDDSLSIDELLRGTDGTLWAIRLRTDCVLKLYRRQQPPQPPQAQQTRTADSQDDRPYLLTFSGTIDAIDRAYRDVTDFAKDALPVTVDAQELGGSPQNALWTWSPPLPPRWQPVASSNFRMMVKESEDFVFRSYVLHHSVYEIPRPQEWTRSSLDRYVAALTNGRPPPHLASDLYCGGAEREPKVAMASHDLAVIELLHDVLHDEAVRPALSTTAFKRALRFVCQRGEAHRPDARMLFVRMEMVGLQLDAETFNIMLGSQVKTQDLRNFGTTLMLMNGRGFPPNLTTWMLFLRLFESEEVKRHILHAMHARGLLDSTRATRAVAQEMAGHDTERAIRQTYSAATATAAASPFALSNTEVLASDDESRVFLSTFLVEQAARYGSSWLSTNTANRVLEVLGRHGRLRDCNRLLALMQRLPDMPLPDVVSFNTVLAHCKAYRSLQQALAVVRRMDGISTDENKPSSAPAEAEALPPVPVAPDLVTFQHLFDLAWLRRLPHVLGVIWHYSCAARLVSTWVRKRVTSVLAGQGAANTVRLVDVFKAPGAVDSNNATSSGPHVNGSPGNVASRRLGAQYDGWEPAVPLSTALAEALERDNALLEKRFTNGRSATVSTMRIPLRRKQSAHNGKKQGKDRLPEDGKTAFIEFSVSPLPPKPAADGRRVRRPTGRSR